MSVSKKESKKSSKIEVLDNDQQKKIEGANPERTLGSSYKTSKVIKLVEKANPQKILNVINTEDVDIKIKQTLKKYLKKRIGSSNRFVVHYGFAKGCDDGRRYAEGLVGLQSIPGEIRRYISGEFYHDVDIRNCMPTIIFHLMKDKNIHCPALQSFVEDRDAMLREMNMEKDTFLHAINTATVSDVSNNTSPFLSQIHYAIYKILVPTLQVDDKWKSLWKKCQTRPYNPQGSFLSRVVRNIEDTILCEMIGWFAKHFAAPDTLIFDGFLVSRSVNIEANTLRSCEKHILGTTGMRIELVEKSMEEDGAPYEQDSLSDLTIFDDQLLNAKALSALKSPTDSDLGCFAALLWKDRYYYDKGQDEWWYFENHCWHFDKGHHFQFRLHEELRKVFNDLDTSSDEVINMISQFQLALGGYGRSRNVMLVAALHFACKDFKRFTEKLNKNLNLLCFQNGVYDFSTHTFRDGQPEDLITIQMDYSWIPYDASSKESVRISKALAQILPQEDKRTYVMRALSSTLTAEHSEKLHLLHGEGGNGKSLLTKLTEESLSGRATAWSTSILTQQFDCCAPNPELADGKDKVFINVQEGKKGGALNMQTVKVITGGDSTRARKLYQNSQKFVIMAQIWLSLNTLPLVQDLDHGTWRRLVVIEFLSTFVDAGMPTNEAKHIYASDPTFKKDIPSLLPSYMALLIEYYKEYEQQGNTTPAVIIAATEKYRKSQNVYQAFFDDCCGPIRGGKVKSVDIWRACQSWAKRENYQVQRPDLKQFLIKSNFIYQESIKFESQVTSGYRDLWLKE